MIKRALIVLAVVWGLVFVAMGLMLCPRNQAYYLPLEAYGWLVSGLSPYKVVYPDNTERSPHQHLGMVLPVLPWDKEDFSSLLGVGGQPKKKTLVVCSRLDEYMVSHYEQGGEWKKINRIVVFDGGHHIATLATEPEVLIVPQVNGLAAHTFMRDAMPVSAVTGILREMGAKTLVITAPRWGVVKCETGLKIWAKKAARYEWYHPAGKENVVTGEHFAIRNGIALAYLTGDGDWQRVRSQCLKHGSLVNKVYLAFDYGRVDEKAAPDMASRLGETLGVPVKIVNVPQTALGNFRLEVR